MSDGVAKKDVLILIIIMNYGYLILIVITVMVKFFSPNSYLANSESLMWDSPQTQTIFMKSPTTFLCGCLLYIRNYSLPRI
ncbi:hypothetical protein EB796_014532 [Bugula neritina]|uniref:Uncharacterized protein n=1 Tax=Bugula neritina TaxID=10212 RepID=A0A7J7JP18_BUGNE|nr:hypothetical protein EB796_014532 [Bugula neritina]